jgi:hypothetical protein
MEGRKGARVPVELGEDWKEGNVAWSRRKQGLYMYGCDYAVTIG